MDDNDHIREIARRILSYLVEHSDSEDTLEGVAEWWLLQQRINVEIEKVRKAVDWLVSRKLILESKKTDLRTLYRVNNERLGEIQYLVEHRQKQKIKQKNTD